MKKIIIGSLAAGLTLSAAAAFMLLSQTQGEAGDGASRLEQAKPVKKEPVRVPTAGVKSDDPGDPSPVVESYLAAIARGDKDTAVAHASLHGRTDQQLKAEIEKEIKSTQEMIATDKTFVGIAPEVIRAAMRYEHTVTGNTAQVRIFNTKVSADQPVTLVELDLIDRGWKVGKVESGPAGLQP